MKKSKHANVDGSRHPHIFIKVDQGEVANVTDPKAKRVYVTVNAAAFTINTIERKFEALQRRLRAFDEPLCKERRAVNPGEVSIHLADEIGNELVAEAWDVIDWIDRLRRIMGVMVGVPRKEMWYAQLMQSIARAEEPRHRFQHFDNTLSYIVKKTYPVMGALIAYFPISGSKARGRIILSTPARFAGDDNIGVAFNVPELMFDVGGVCLSVAQETVCVSGMVHDIRAARTYFARYLSARYGFAWPASRTDSGLAIPNQIESSDPIS